MDGECRIIGYGGDCGEMRVYIIFKGDIYFLVLLNYFYMCI